MKYFSSDWHLFHRNVIKFSDRPFKTLDEMNQEIIRRAFSKLKAGDSLYLLGDISWNEEAI
jgi:calcineurin-like phosphoesterase family protein